MGICSRAANIASLGLEKSLVGHITAARDTHAVVEGPARHVGKVPETIPLCTTLCIHGVKIIVGKTFSQSFDLMFEGLTAKCRLIWDIEWKTGQGLTRTKCVVGHDVLHRNNFACPDLLGCSSHTRRC